jgi:carbonic anhydrase
MLQVRHIMVVGHYGCGGVRATLNNVKIGLADNWLRHVQDVQLRHKTIIDAAAPEARVDLLCELNVIEQVVNVCRTTVVQDAWARGQQLKVHGWVYGLNDGIVNDLDLTVDEPTMLDGGYAQCHENIRRRYDVLNVK